MGYSPREEEGSANGRRAVPAVSWVTAPRWAWDSQVEAQGDVSWNVPYYDEVSMPHRQEE